MFAENTCERFVHVRRRSTSAAWALISFRSKKEKIGAASFRGLSVWGLMTWVNKVGGGPRFLSSAKMRSCRMPVSINRDGVSFFKMLRLRTPLGASCLEIVGSVGIRSYAPVAFF
jgi:hypothetical protein